MNEFPWVLDYNTHTLLMRNNGFCVVACGMQYPFKIFSLHNPVEHNFALCGSIFWLSFGARFYRFVILKPVMCGGGGITTQ
jgi:hypothetical protein